jgi:hypothetical protein
MAQPPDPDPAAEGDFAHPVGALLTAALNEIRDELDRVLWNRHQRDDGSPFLNTGARFECAVFQVHAYDWAAADDPDHLQPWNFRWKDVMVRWYKHFRRGASVNRALAPGEVEVLLEDCLATLDAYDRETTRLDAIADADAAAPPPG